MATKTSSGLQKATAIYNAMSPASRATVEAPTEENSKAFGQAIMNYEAVKNDFINSMINVVVYGWCRNAEDKDPFSIMESPPLEYGYTVEEAYADALDATDWSACESTNVSEIFSPKPPRVYTNFHSLNFQKRVKATISDKQMRRAFYSWNGLNDLIARIVRTLYTSMIGERRRAAENLLAISHTGGFSIPVVVNDVPNSLDSIITSINADEMRANAIIEQAIVNRLSVCASRDYNYMGVSTITDISNCYIFLMPEYVAAQGVEVLAMVFNMDKAEMLGHIVMVPSFGGVEKDGAVGFICDKEWFKIFAQNRQITSQYNPVQRSWNYWYHDDSIFSTSLFSNCVELVSSLKTITSVTIKAGQTARKCNTTPIECDVVNGGEKGGWTSKCTWSISGQTSDNTFISPFGALYVAPDETASTISVTATSVQDNTKKSTVNVTVTA